MSGYIGDISSIYRVSEAVDTIFHGDLSNGRNIAEYQQKIGKYGGKSSIFCCCLQRDPTAQIMSASNDHASDAPN